MLREYTEELVKGLVDRPDYVSVNEKTGTNLILLQISVHDSEFGCVIGKNGRNIEAIRIILQGVARKLKKYVIVELVE